MLTHEQLWCPKQIQDQLVSDYVSLPLAVRGGCSMML